MANFLLSDVIVGLMHVFFMQSIILIGMTLVFLSFGQLQVPIV